MNTERINRGDIYWIDINPNRNQGAHVQRASRPAIIVSDDSINRQNYAHEIVYLTTAPKVDQKTHCTIRSSTKVSTALCEQVQTVSHEQIGRYIGTCTKKEMEAVERGMMISLALDIPNTPDTAEEDQLVTPEIWQEMDRLTIEMEKAKHEAALMRKLYEDLLQKTLNLTTPK